MYYTTLCAISLVIWGYGSCADVIPGNSFELTLTNIFYENLKINGLTTYNLQSCAYPNGEVMVYVISQDIVYGIYRDPDALEISTMHGFSYSSTSFIVDCHQQAPMRSIYISSLGPSFYSLLNGTAEQINVGLTVGGTKMILNVNTIEETYVAAITPDGLFAYLYDMGGSLVQSRAMPSNSYSEVILPVDTSTTKYGKAVSINVSFGQSPILTVYQCNTTDFICPTTTWQYPTLYGRFQTQNSFADYGSIVYWSFLDAKWEYLNIQTVPPSNIAYEYETQFLRQSMVALGSDYQIVVFSGITPNGSVILGTWDTTRPVSEVNVTILDYIDPSYVSTNNPISMVRINDYMAQVSYVDFLLHGWIVNISISENPIIIIGPNENITINGNQTLSVNQSITVDTLTVGQNSTLVVQEGVVITVTGCANLAGNLVIVLSNGTILEAKDNTEIELLVLNATCRSGEFNSVETRPDYDLDTCEKLMTRPNYSPSQLTIVISVDDSSCSDVIDPPYDQTALIIGVCVAGGAVLIVGILLLSFYYSPLRAKVFPYSKPK